MKISMKVFEVVGRWDEPDAVIDLLEVNGVDVTNEYIHDKSKPVKKGTLIVCKDDCGFSLVKLKEGRIYYED